MSMVIVDCESMIVNIVSSLWFVKFTLYIAACLHQMSFTLRIQMLNVFVFSISFNLHLYFHCFDSIPLDLLPYLFFIVGYRLLLFSSYSFSLSELSTS